MRRHALVFGALLLASAASGSAQEYVSILKDKSAYPTAMSAGRCTTASCVITVTVGEKCALKADPEIAVLTKYPATVLWHLKSPGYVFPKSDGITFKFPNNAFSESRRLADDVWQWKIKAPGKKQEYFAYNIVVQNAKTNQTCKLDPGLITDW